MQYYTPMQSGGQAHAANPFSETQASCRPPQVIGEGDVASFVLPDGSIQLYFVPSPFSRCPPSPNYQPFVNQQQQPPWNSYPDAWLIRTIPDQLLACPNPNVCRPQCQPGQPENSNPSFLQSRYQSRTGYQLKFHNDGCTSTTDIYHFGLSVRQRAWLPQHNTGTQAASPPPTPLSDGSQTVDGHPCCCEKPGHCFNSYGRRDQVHNIFVTTYEPERNKLQIPRVDFQTGERSPSVEVLHDKIQKKSSRFGKSRAQSSRGCDSECLERAHKSTATYTCAATGDCGPASATQTGGAELWYPASPAARAALASASDTSTAPGSDA